MVNSDFVTDGTLVVDIDGTLCDIKKNGQSYSDLIPNKQFITKLYEYKKKGYKISKQKFSSFTGQIVLVTGGAGVIGSQIAKDFKKQGAEVILLDISEEGLLKTQKELGPEVKYYQCDLTNISEIKRVFKKLLLNFGGIDLVVSNAGAASECSLENLNFDLFESSMKINLYSHYFISQEAIKIFKFQDFKEVDIKKMIGGQLLFNISKQALNPGPNFGSYGIAKSGLVALMKQYALEAADSNIRSNGINADRIKSGLLNTDLITKRAKSRGLSEDEYMRGNLLKSEVLPHDVSNAFVSLALMKKTTGAILTVDGGNIAAMVR